VVHYVYMQLAPAEWMRGCHVENTRLSHGDLCKLPHKLGMWYERFKAKFHYAIQIQVCDLVAGHSEVEFVLSRTSSLGRKLARAARELDSQRDS